MYVDLHWLSFALVSKLKWCEGQIIKAREILTASDVKATVVKRVTRVTPSSSATIRGNLCHIFKTVTLYICILRFVYFLFI